MIKEIKGDILSNPTNETIICHQVNLKGVMGSGLAKQIRDKYPNVFEEYKIKCSSARPLGDVQFVKTDDCIIANLFGQDGYGTDKRYTDYDALRKCFETVSSSFPNATIRIPYKIGCGLGGGDWNIVKVMIDEEFKNHEVEIWRWNGNKN